jgi:hypothetical protein
MILNIQGGLNPITDMAAALKGESSYMAALGLQAHLGNIPLTFDRQLAQAPRQFDNLIARFNQAFPGENITRDSLLKKMRSEGIIEGSAMRNIDIGDMMQSEDATAILAQGSKFKRGLKNLTTIDPAVNPITKFGFKEGQKIQDTPRIALFLDRMKKVSGTGVSYEDAVRSSIDHTKKHLFDYTDLTKFEQQAKAFIPFYTWTAKNLPLQIEKLVTDTGKFAPLSRAYNGAWNNYEKELEPEDLPKWLSDNLAFPVNKTTDKDGVETFSVWDGSAWLPQTELNSLADLARGQFKEVLLSKINPVIKEPLEQAYNIDSFTGRAIDEGNVADVFGMTMPPRAAHLIRNVRLISEIDRLNPLGAWNKLGQFFGRFEKDRPHRREVPQGERFLRFFGGLKLSGIEPEKEASGKIFRTRKDMNSALAGARRAQRLGQTAERERFMSRYEDAKAELSAILRRQGERRQDLAIKQMGAQR